MAGVNTGRTRFAGKGLGTSQKVSPVCIRFSPEITQVIRSIPNYSDYLRGIIIEVLAEDGHLSEES